MSKNKKLKSDDIIEPIVRSLYNGNYSKVVKGINGNYYMITQYPDGWWLCYFNPANKFGLIKTNLKLDTGSDSFNYVWDGVNYKYDYGYYIIDKYLYIIQQPYIFRRFDMLEMQADSKSFKLVTGPKKMMGYIFVSNADAKTQIFNMKTFEFDEFDYNYQCHNENYVAMYANSNVLYVFDVIRKKMVVNAYVLQIPISRLELVGQILVIHGNPDAQRSKPINYITLGTSQHNYCLDIDIKFNNDEIILSTVKHIFDKYECRIKQLPKSNIIDTLAKLYDILNDVLAGLSGDSIYIEIEDSTKPLVRLVINYKYLVERHEFVLNKVLTDQMSILDNKVNWLIDRMNKFLL